MARHCNTERPHSALGYRTRMEVLNSAAAISWVSVVWPIVDTQM